MEKILKKFKENLPKLTVEPKDHTNRLGSINYMKGGLTETHYYVSGFDGNEEIQLKFRSNQEGNDLYELARKKPYIFPDFLAVRCGDVIEVLLTNVSFRSSIRSIINPEESFTKFIELSLSYYKNDLLIEFEVGQNKNNTLPQLLSFTIEGRFYGRKPTILKINN